VGEASGIGRFCVSDLSTSLPKGRKIVLGLVLFPQKVKESATV